MKKHCMALLIIVFIIMLLAGCGGGGGGSSQENIAPSPAKAQWAQTVTAGSSASDFYSVSVASDGSVYAAGIIYGTGTYDFGNSKTAKGTNSGVNIVLVKYDSSGVAQWAQTVTAGSSNSYFYSVSV